MPLQTSVNESKALALIDFATDYHFPQTVQIVEGYESLETEELSWSQGEIVNLHSLKEQVLAIARDEKGQNFAIPVTYPKRIFEIIPKSSKADDPCRGTERVNSAKLMTVREILDGHRTPISVRIEHGLAEVMAGNNKAPFVKFAGVFLFTEAVKRKIFIASSMIGQQLRIMSLPADLQITVKRERSKLPPMMFSRICHLIKSEVNIDTTITSGSSGDASWFFDLNEETKIERPADDDDDVYDEIRPPVPARSPSLQKFKQHNSRSKDHVRYTPNPRKIVTTEKSSGPAVAPRQKATHRQPPVAPKPAVPVRRSFPSEISKAAERDLESQEYCEIKEVMPEIQNRALGDADEALVKKRIQKKGPAEMGEDSELSVSSGYSSLNTLPSPNRKQTVNEVNQKLKGMSVPEVSECLKKLGLSKYVDSFAEELIDGVMLMELDDEMMQQLGVEKLHRKKLSLFIQEGYTPKR